MKLLDKLKNVFFEEVEEDEEEEIPQSFAKKVEIPKKVREQIKKEEIETPEKEDVEVKEEVIEKPIVVEEKEEKEKEFPMMFDESDFLEDEISPPEEVKTEIEKPIYRREDRPIVNDDHELYQGKKEISYIESVNRKSSYSYTKNYYEDKDVKGFRPSPIISPIYGILDRNYHSEEVVTKRETRVVSNYNKPDLDSIRNKAFGSEETRRSTPEAKHDKVKKEEVEGAKIYDVNNNKPQVNRVTLADADEYYNDLGLAYNVDYSDASRNATRSAKYNPKEKKNNSSVDDNLFDLIDSMYNKED